jgi:hypothetical protein
LNLSNSQRNLLIIAGLLSLVAGISIGLIYGYVINPIEWVDVPLELSREDIQEEYLRMAIDSYKLYRDQAKAYERWQELGEAGPDILTKVSVSPGPQGVEAINAFKNAVILDLLPERANCEGCAVETSNNLCVFLWLGTIVFVGVLGIYFYFRTQDQAPRRAFIRAAQTKVKEPEEVQPFITDDSTPPLVHTMTTYVLGDDLFDESYSIEMASGEFLGECGIGIVNTLGEGSPKKVNAFDLWLFDKNEINTKATVLMSEQAFRDDILRTQLTSKGTPVLAEIGREIRMESNHLQMRVRIVDMVCEESDPQKCAYFQRLSLELLVQELS